MNRRMERVLGIRQSNAAGRHQDKRQRRQHGPKPTTPDYQPGVWWQYDPTEGWVQVEPPEGV